MAIVMMANENLRCSFRPPPSSAWFKLDLGFKLIPHISPLCSDDEVRYRRILEKPHRSDIRYV